MGVQRDPDIPPSRFSPTWATQSKSQKRYTIAQWNRYRISKGYVAVDPPLSLGIDTTQRPPGGGVQESITWNEFQYRRKNPQAEGDPPSPDTNLDSPSPSADSNVAPSEKRPLESPAEGQSPSKVPRPAAGEPDTGGEAGTSGGPTGRVIQAQDVEMAAPGAGHNSASDGGFDSTQGPESSIGNKSYSNNSGNMKFKQVHHIKSWALPFTKINKAAAVAGPLYTTTPLMYIPWDQMMLYMSEEQFNLIPRPAKVKSCKVSVQHLTSSVQFETAVSNSEIAATGHAKIMVTAENIENKVRGCSIKKYKWSGTDMKVASIEDYNPRDFSNAAYGVRQHESGWNTTLAPVNLGIPLYSSDYLTIVENNEARAKARGIVAANAPGAENFIQHVSQTNMNDSTWDTVMEKSYTFTDARIGKPYQVFELDNESVNLAVGHDAHNLPIERLISDVGPTTDEAGCIYANTIKATRESFYPEVNYTGYIEQGAVGVKGLKGNKPCVQPTLYVGMRAIDRNVPASTAIANSFVNAYAYWVITAEIEIELPSYPMGRYLRPPIFTHNVENAEMGIGLYQVFNGVRTFGLPKTTTTRPKEAVVTRSRTRRSAADTEQASRVAKMLKTDGD
uniref:VP n=1 Tax=uncultured densovirus TaxID=748192 RepID=A0A7L7YUG5_9VIRU|nr:VP [uncultured densovirus]